jgi:hypothetical protein
MCLKLKPKAINNAKIKGILHLGKDTGWILGLLVSEVKDWGAAGR